jgi:hypothetical protein
MRAIVVGTKEMTSWPLPSRSTEQPTMSMSTTTRTSLIVPTVANAVFGATGKRLRKMPVDPALLREA